MVKLIFIAYKELIKHFLMIFPLYIKMLTRYYKTKQRKASKKNTLKVSKSFLRR